jgi:hypothetical protein
MKIFISWSGKCSNDVAIALKMFIEIIFRTSVEVFVSSKDIELGERWSERLKYELQVSDYGILVITKENKEAPWIMFEAGALSNCAIPIVPFLFDLKPYELGKNPISVFQSLPNFDKAEDIYKLIKSINKSLKNNQFNEEVLIKYFISVYSYFEEALSEIKKINQRRYFF